MIIGKICMAIKETCLEYLNSTKGKCCGCGSCFNICPTKAISMVYNSYGFLEPSIDEEKCVHCGICKNACPIFNHVEKKINNNTDTPKRYVFSGSSEVLSKSSSGGAFTYIANKILNDGGYVVGAAYNDDFSVSHIIVNGSKDLNKLRLSKYVQSDQNDCYVQVKKLLTQDKTVLYTGTPCQIAGLKSFLRNKDFSNLYTVDLLCHGVPPYKLLREYLETHYGIDNIAEIFMRRTKDWAVCLDVKLKDGRTDESKGARSIYMNAFLKDIVLRESCYGCKFASLPRYGDITIGDCWNAKKLKFQEPFNKKSSIVIVNNHKGEKLWNSSLNNVSQVSMQDISNIDKKNLNANVYKPNAKRTNNVDTFWENYKTMNFTESYLKTILGENPVGLILYGSNNYGSCATNLALYLAIENMGFAPVILDSLVPTRGISKEYLSKNCRTSQNLFKKNEVNLVNKIFSSFVVGSDYSFNISAAYTRNHLEYLLMAFADNTNRKIAYAPSLGLPDFEHDDNTKFLYKHMLERFDFLSFREDSAVEHCKKYLNIDSQTVLDPVFLINKNTYLNVAKKSKLKNISNYILVYILDPTPQKIELVKKYEQLFGLKKFVILDLDNYDKNSNAFDDGILGKLSFEDFIYYFMNAEFIITDSFHGTCFSLIFNKKYISLKNRNRRRFDTLINLLKKDINYIPIFDKIADAYDSSVKTVDYNFAGINKILDICRRESNDLLNNSLVQAPKTNEDSTDINIQYIKLWRQNYNLNRQIALNKQVTPVAKTSDIDYEKIWKNVSSKLQNHIPSYLELSKVYSKFYYRIYFKGINHKIHYELLFIKDKYFFGIHCEDKTLEEVCRSSFENIQQSWDIKNPKSLFKLNNPIDLTNTDSIIDSGLGYIKKVEGIVTKLLSIEQLHI